jgi:hypothetical protein
MIACWLLLSAYCLLPTIPPMVPESRILSFPHLPPTANQSLTTFIFNNIPAYNA